MSASASFIVYDRPAVYPASMQENARIGARVKTVRTDHGLTQAEFGKKLAVTRGAVGNWERGEGIKRENLQAIAETFEVSFDWLATGSSSTLGAPVSVAEAGLPKFAGFVQAGGWLAVDEYFNQDRYEVPEFVLRQPQYTKVRQYAYLVRGDSVDLAGIHDGEWIVAADAADYIDQYGDLESGDLVVVERTRFQGAEREMTVKEIRYYRDRYELHPKSSNPTHKPIVVPHNEAPDDETEVKIVGVVLTAFKNLHTRKAQRA
jgi:transcriptional regulator with XRE-family HTH domain